MINIISIFWSTLSQHLLTHKWDYVARKTLFVDFVVLWPLFIHIHQNIYWLLFKIWRQLKYVSDPFWHNKNDFAILVNIKSAPVLLTHKWYHIALEVMFKDLIASRLIVIDIHQMIYWLYFKIRRPYRLKYVSDPFWRDKNDFSILVNTKAEPVDPQIILDLYSHVLDLTC